MQAIIETRQLTHTYSQGTPFEHTALDRVDFSAQAGEYLAVIGRTGSGKSTLIQHLNGLLKPTSGQVLFDGADIWEDKSRTRQVRCQVGLVFQYPEYQLFEETVYQDIAFGPKNMGLDGDEVDRRVKQSARFVGLEPGVLEKSPFDLSGGQQRRVAFAGVLAMEPEVLVLDEPVAGLDPLSRADFLALIASFHASGMTVVMVSHSMEDLAVLADRILVLSEGRMFSLGTPAEVFADPAALKAVGLAAPAPQAFANALREAGFALNRALYDEEALAADIAAQLDGIANGTGEVAADAGNAAPGAACGDPRAEGGVDHG